MLQRPVTTRTPSPTPFVAAIDAGGTKTVAVIADLDGRELGRGHAGPGNPAVAGPQASRRALSTALHAAAGQARIEEPSLAARAEMLRIGLAGVELPEHAQPYATWARDQGLCTRAIASNDAHLVFDWAATELELAVIAGTGSTCWARTPGGETRRVGGWGYLADDRGSGFALGSAALHLAVRSLDGRSHEPEFERIVFEHWHADSEAELLEELHRGHYAEARRLISALSVRVFELADAGSASAQALIDARVDELVELIACAGQGARGGVLIFVGSMVCKRASMRQAVIDRLGFEPSSVRIADDPVGDGIRQACRLVETET